MKKALAILLALAALALLFHTATRCAYERGVIHAIRDSELWILENGDDPYIHIYLDGDWYVHSGYTG